MKPILLFLAILSGTSFSLKREKSNPPSVHFELKALAPGVWAAINNDNGGHAICNAGIIDLGDRTLLFDPFMNLDAAEDLKQAAQELTGKPASLIINSHHHNDHIRGNQLFQPASIISTAWTRRQIATEEPKELQWEKEHAGQILASYQKQQATATGTDKEELPLWIGYFEGMVKSGPQIRTTLPNVTFSDSLWIHGTTRQVKLLEFKNGHTGSDVALFLPAEGIVFTGDLLFRGRHPWMGDGNPQSWTQHLNTLKDNPRYTQFVPGHGDPGDPHTVEELIRYFNDLDQLVGNQLASRPDSVIVKTPIPDAYSKWPFRRFYRENLAFLCEWKRRD